MSQLRDLTEDYTNSSPNARDPEVLLLFSVMLKHAGDLMADFLPTIMQSLCQSTLQMIQQDTTTYPEFRDGFFRLVMNIIKHCANGLFQQSGESFQTVVYTVIFAMQHEKPDLMELGNESMHSLCMTLAESPSFATIFYQNFFTTCMKEIITVLTDYRHMAGFKMQGQIVQLMLQAIDSETTVDPSVRLNDLSGNPH
jgi:exportin-1